eukprot:9326930-Pyramimonas_sp.AAC.1
MGAAGLGPTADSVAPFLAGRSPRSRCAGPFWVSCRACANGRCHMRKSTFARIMTAVADHVTGAGN